MMKIKVLHNPKTILFWGNNPDPMKLKQALRALTRCIFAYVVLQ